MPKGSRKNKFAILGVEAPGRQGAKTQGYLDIPSFRNTVGRDASASKMLSYFWVSPKLKASCKYENQYAGTCSAVDFRSDFHSGSPEQDCTKRRLS